MLQTTNDNKMIALHFRYFKLLNMVINRWYQVFICDTQQYPLQCFDTVGWASLL